MSVHLDEGVLLASVGHFDYYESVVLKAKKRGQVPAVVKLTTGFKAVLFEHVEELDVLGIRVARAGSSAVMLMILDPANPAAEVTPVDLRSITLLTPNPAFDANRAHEYLDSIKKDYDKAVNKATTEKVKRAKIYHTSSNNHTHTNTTHALALHH